MDSLKNFRLNKFIDFLFFSVCIFLIVFAYLRFLRCNIAVSSAFALLTVVLAGAIRQLIKHKKQSKKALDLVRSKRVNDCMMSLLTNDKIENETIFKNILMAQNNGVVVLNCDLMLYENEALYLGFDKDELDYLDSLRAIKKAINKGARHIRLLCISCKTADKIKLESIENITVEIVEKEEVYLEYFDGKNYLPKQNISFKKQNKIKLRQLKEMSLTREKSKKYFLYGLMIFFCSLIVRYNFYYVFMSSILFLLSILSRKKPAKNIS